jgi:hypothetical protein
MTLYHNAHVSWRVGDVELVWLCIAMWTEIRRCLIRWGGGWDEWRHPVIWRIYLKLRFGRILWRLKFSASFILSFTFTIPKNMDLDHNHDYRINGPFLSCRHTHTHTYNDPTLLLASWRLDSVTRTSPLVLYFRLLDLFIPSTKYVHFAKLCNQVDGFYLGGRRLVNLLYRNTGTNSL